MEQRMKPRGDEMGRRGAQEEERRRFLFVLLWVLGRSTTRQVRIWRKEKVGRQLLGISLTWLFSQVSTRLYNLVLIRTTTKEISHNSRSKYLESRPQTFILFFDTESEMFESSGRIILMGHYIELSEYHGPIYLWKSMNIIVKCYPTYHLGFSLTIT